MLQPTARVASCLARGAQLQGVVRRAPLACGLPMIAGRKLQLSTTTRRRADEEISEQTFFPDTSKPSSTAQAAADDVPWYLKVDVPKHATLVPQETQLPAVPTGAPALVTPLLTYVADDLGLDELQLLDLRGLEPPAALGPELLMLFGTARSERHLHVSADRLVRWLRTRGIRASADGLLGRNELKIKLRRKARRAKLLGNLGPAAGEVDDGISTQWVCLHAGTVGRRGQEGRVLDSAGRVSGFGAQRTGGTTLVVQMFTEAKRKQLDLETLWSRALARSLKQQAEEEGEVAPASGAPESLPPSSGLSQQRFFSTAASRRLFSTSARRPAVASDHSIFTRLTDPALGSAGLEQLHREMARDPAGKEQLLPPLLAYFDALGRHDAMRALGVPVPGGDAAVVPTQFAQAASYCMRGLPAEATWAFRARIHAAALRLGTPTYTLAGMRTLVEEMQRGGIALPRETALHLLRGLLSCPLADENRGAKDGPSGTLRERSALALSLLDTLHARGQAVVASDVLVTMIAALARVSWRPDGPYGIDGAAPPQPGATYAAAEALQTVLERLMRQARLPCPDERTLLRLLDAYAEQNDWRRFWAAWRLPPQHFCARSAGLYAFVLRRLAQTGSRARCIDALRLCYPEMLSEQPPVQPTSAVLTALKACIHVADPRAEYLASQLSSAHYQEGWSTNNIEFVKILKRVQDLGTS